MRPNFLITQKWFIYYYQLLLTAEATLFHIPLVDAAICDIAPTQAITMSETIRPYSTAVAPRSLRTNLCKILIIDYSALQFPGSQKIDMVIRVKELIMQAPWEQT